MPEPDLTSDGFAKVAVQPAREDLDLTERAEAFELGERVVITEVLDGDVWTVRPVTVVADAVDLIALWLEPGTVTRYPAGPQHGVHTVDHWLAHDWQLTNRTWVGPGTLRFTRPGDPFDVWVSPPDTDSSFQGWYVNMQEPLRRVCSGFVTMDKVLDLVIARDLSSWEWKDEDEFAYAQASGLFNASEARAIRSAAEEVVAGLNAGSPPWDISWADWRPDTNTFGDS